VSFGLIPILQVFAYKCDTLAAGAAIKRNGRFSKLCNLNPTTRLPANNAPYAYSFELGLMRYTAVDKPAAIPQLRNPCFTATMHPVLISCRFLLDTVRALLDGVRVRDGVYVDRPAFGTRAMARRLATGLAHVEAYLRRLLLVMALELEPTLVDVQGPMRRPHGRKKKGKGAPHFCILPKELPPSPALLYAFDRRKGLLTRSGDPQPVAMARLYQRLDHLTNIVASPLARAKRLAFHLARNKEGPILAPNSTLRPPGAWGTQARASFFSLEHDILTRSKNRPPPLRPPRRCWPSVTRL
jgi:hypothetical protein